MSLRRDVTIRLDGRRIAAAWWGEGNAHVGAPVLVLLHEGLGSISLWRDFPAAIAAATGCPVFAYERFGYGNSDAAPLPWSVRYLHDEALAVLPRVLDAAGIERAITLGHSDGATIGLIHAGGAQDSRLRGTIVIAPHLFVEEIALTGIERAGVAYRSGDLRARLARHHRDPDNPFRGWSGTWLDPGFRDWRIDDYVPTILVPALGIQGSEDEYGTAAQLEVLAREARCAVEIHLLAGAGHAPHLSHEGEVLARIVPFIARIRAADGDDGPGDSGLGPVG